MGARSSSLGSPKSPSYDDLPLEPLDLVIAQQYDDLPLELVDLVIARLPDPADRARTRAVCRQWHSAVHRHGPQPWRMPSAMDAKCRLRCLPRDANSMVSTDGWLAVRIGKEHKYLLHNPFFNKTVPLAELEGVIVDGEAFIYKFLMRSGVDDFIAIINNNMRYAFMVTWPGKGVWLPEPRTYPYADIIDFAFLQGKLYAITNAEDLIPFTLALDGEGRPVVTMERHLIKQSPYYDGQQVPAALEDITILNCSVRPSGPVNDLQMTSRHLIESRGKLLMVRHHKKYRPKTHLCHGAPYFTFQVEVFEANTDTGVWMPVTGGLGGGQALFLSFNFSKSVAAPCGEVEEGAIYFMGTGEVFDLKSGTSRPLELCRDLGLRTWLFHPELVI